MNKNNKTNNKFKSKGRNYKGKKPAFRRNDCDRFAENKQVSDSNFNAEKSAPNDPRWYATNEALLRDSASFSYNNPVGASVYWGDNPLLANMNGTTIPGIFAMYTTFCYGESQDPTSAINIAMRNAFTWNRMNNSGRVNFDAPDQMIYFCAMDSLYAYWAFLKRIYGIVATYSYTNRYFPIALVNSMGVSFHSISRNLAGFRYYINLFADRISAYAVPATMPFMARHMWMYSGYYADSVSDKAQMYHYSPESFYRYTLDADGAGCLVPIPFYSGSATSAQILDDGDMYPNDAYADWNPDYITPEGLWTYEGLIEYGNRLLNPILQSEDFNIISGDVLKAWGKENCYTTTQMDENYIVLPLYSEEVLSQFTNATMWGRSTFNDYSEFWNDGLNDVATPNQNSSNVLLQDASKGWLNFNPVARMVINDKWSFEESPARYYQAILSSNKMINMHKGDISPSDTMVASRMVNGGRTVSTQPWSSLEGVNSSAAKVLQGRQSSKPSYYLTNTLTAVGSDRVCFAQIWYQSKPNRGTGSGMYLYHTEDIYTVLTTYMQYVAGSAQPAGVAAQKTADDIRRINFISNFDWHPQIMFLTTYDNIDETGKVTSTECMPLSGYLYDVDYYTTVTLDNLINMNRTAMISLFNVSQVGSSQANK